LFGALTNGNPVSAAILAAASSANPGAELIPVPTAVPPSARRYTPSSAAFEAVEIVRQHSGIPGPFLAQRQRGSVLHVRAADLDDVKSIPPPSHGSRRAGAAIAGIQVLLHVHRSRDVHRRRKRVVRGLRHVHVIVRVHGRLLPSGVPASWQQRFEMTSFTFMLNCVPLPVIQTCNGNIS